MPRIVIIMLGGFLFACIVVSLAAFSVQALGLPNWFLRTIVVVCFPVAWIVGVIGLRLWLDGKRN